MIDDIYQVTLVSSLQGQVIENVLHYRLNADADQPAVVDGIQTYFNSTICPAFATFLSSNFRFDSIRIQKIWPLPARIAVEVPLGIQGNVSTVALPAEVALVITKQTFLAGRANRGRMYLAGMPNDSYVNTTGKFTDGVMIDVQSAALTLLQIIPTLPSGGSVTPVLYHRLGHTWIDLTAMQSRNIPRCQRRRQIGRGI